MGAEAYKKDNYIDLKRIHGDFNFGLNFSLNERKRKKIYGKLWEVPKEISEDEFVDC